MSFSQSFANPQKFQMIGMNHRQPQEEGGNSRLNEIYKCIDCLMSIWLYIVAPIRTMLMLFHFC